jgi:hypothetical protein
MTGKRGLNGVDLLWWSVYGKGTLPGVSLALTVFAAIAWQSAWNAVRGHGGRTGKECNVTKERGRQDAILSPVFLPVVLNKSFLKDLLANPCEFTCKQKEPALHANQGGSCWRFARHFGENVACEKNANPENHLCRILRHNQPVNLQDDNPNPPLITSNNRTESDSV